MNEVAGTPHEKREDIKAEYDAEFEPETQEQAGVVAEVRTELAKLEAGSSLAALLGPSSRQQITRIELAFRTKLRDMEAELAEMMEREVALKQANRVTVDHNRKLAEERDYWLNMHDPQRVNSALREDAAKSKTLYDGAQKEIAELTKERDKLREKFDELTRPAPKKRAKAKKRAARKKR